MNAARHFACAKRAAFKLLPLGHDVRRRHKAARVAAGRGIAVRTQAGDKGKPDVIDVARAEDRVIRQSEEAVGYRFRDRAPSYIAELAAFPDDIRIDHRSVDELCPHCGPDGGAFFAIPQQHWKEMIAISSPGAFLRENNVLGACEV